MAGLADRIADELAEQCWARRHKLPPRFGSPEEAIRKARDARFARKLGVASQSVHAFIAGEHGDS